MSGIMAITGHEETGPTRAGFAVCDVLSGATAAFGISSALFQRTRHRQGPDGRRFHAGGDTSAFLSGPVADVTPWRAIVSNCPAIRRQLPANG